MPAFNRRQSALTEQTFSANKNGDQRRNESRRIKDSHAAIERFLELLPAYSVLLRMCWTGSAVTDLPPVQLGATGATGRRKGYRNRREHHNRKDRNHSRDPNHLMHVRM